MFTIALILMSEDTIKHDTIVTNALKELMREVGVIVLAQPSMARVVDALRVEEKSVSIQASPAISIKNYQSFIFKKHIKRGLKN
ncbi:hypothetical protein [Flavobacterium maritimum]|uniref:hypothetical protein n=1 Tax=Flavobacterium maritimum TaxID=3149042 RepID=UPI0032B3CAC4